MLQRPKASRSACLITLALVLIFSMALMMRVYPARYGFYLNEYDPYYNYYATSFIVKNAEQHGLGVILSNDPQVNYFLWRDHKTWYPEGRPVAVSSQSGLHFAGASLYLLTKHIFGLKVNLYDFLVLFPVFFGAFTTIVIYLIVKRFAGTIGGLFAALMISVSPPIILRGNLGWFKSEPFALFTALLAIYFFLSLFDSKALSRGFILRAVAAGLLLGYSHTAWGGAQYFSLVLGILLIAIPFLGVSLEKALYSSAFLVPLALLVSAAFPRPGPSFITNPIGLVLLAGLFFILIAFVVKRAVAPKSYIHTILVVLFVFIVVGIIAISLGLTLKVSARYLTVVNPFYRTGIPLVESVAEHFVPTGSEYFISYYILLFLGGFGSYLAFKRKSLDFAFALVLGISAIYISSSFSRLLVYSSIALAILAGIGFKELTESILKPSVAPVAKKKVRIHETRVEVKAMYCAVMLLLLTTPLLYPTNNWLSAANNPVSIANAGTGFLAPLPDWMEALKWMRENTPEDAVFAAWWDYGYWIAVMGNRTSLADNATINSTRIAQLARMFMSSENESLRILGQLKADYVVVFVAGEKVRANGKTLYILGGGGDESKKQWFIRIGGFNLSRYLYEDEFTPRPYFWENSFLGKLLPFELYQYVDEAGRFVGKEYKRGYTAVYEYRMKYPKGGEGPLELVFVSSSLREEERGIFAGVVIYRVVR